MRASAYVRAAGAKGAPGRAQEDTRGWSMARALAEYKRWEWRDKGYSDTKEERWRQMAKERWEKEHEQKEGGNGENTDSGTKDMRAEEAIEDTREETEKGGAQSQRKRAREAQQGSEDDEERSRRQRGAQEQREWGEQDGGLSGSHEVADKQRNRHEGLRSEEQSRQEQSESEPTQAAGAETARTQQRAEREQDDGSNSRKRKGKEKMNTHQMKQMDAQQSKATTPASSDEEAEEDEQRRRRQREHEDGRSQPNVHEETPQTVQEGDGTATPEDIEAHEKTRARAELFVSGGSVTVNESVYARRNPTRGARPQKEAEAKEPVRKKATKGPIFKGTYLQRTGAAGGQLKFMIRLGERAIERMEGTYEKAKPPRRGHER